MGGCCSEKRTAQTTDQYRQFENEILKNFEVRILSEPIIVKVMFKILI